MNINLPFIPILSAIGASVGAFIGSYIQSKSTKNTNLFNKKLSIYLQLIESYSNAVIHNSDPVSKEKYVMSQRQVEIIASDEIVRRSKEFYRNSSTKNDMPMLINAMRKDLLSK